MTTKIKENTRPIDHIKKIFLMQIDAKCLTFAQNAGEELVSYERLKELHEAIGETLKHKLEYEKFKKWYDNEISV